MFQHTAARRRLGFALRIWVSVSISFNTQPPEGGWGKMRDDCGASSGFNTQPPEGGWFQGQKSRRFWLSFNTQPPEGGWALTATRFRRLLCFNTQPPEGGWAVRPSACRFFRLFQHTAARRRLGRCRHRRDPRVLFQHTAARRRLVFRCPPVYPLRGFNTQPPEGGWNPNRQNLINYYKFQHTAARRRLGKGDVDVSFKPHVSTHSRLKAAGISGRL